MICFSLLTYCLVGSDVTERRTRLLVVTCSLGPPENFGVAPPSSRTDENRDDVGHVVMLYCIWRQQAPTTTELKLLISAILLRLLRHTNGIS